MTDSLVTMTKGDLRSSMDRNLDSRVPIMPQTGNGDRLETQESCFFRSQAVWIQSGALETTDRATAGQAVAATVRGHYVSIELGRQRGPSVG